MDFSALSAELRAKGGLFGKPLSSVATDVGVIIEYALCPVCNQSLIPNLSEVVGHCKNTSEFEVEVGVAIDYHLQGAHGVTRDAIAGNIKSITEERAASGPSLKCIGRHERAIHFPALASILRKHVRERNQDSFDSRTLCLPLYTREFWDECGGRDATLDTWGEAMKCMMRLGCSLADQGQSPVALWVGDDCFDPKIGTLMTSMTEIEIFFAASKRFKHLLALGAAKDLSVLVLPAFSHTSWEKCGLPTSGVNGWVKALRQVLEDGAAAINRGDNPVVVWPPPAQLISWLEHNHLENNSENRSAFSQRYFKKLCRLN